MILLIDNYDSFVYNLYQLIGGISPDIRVIRNDACTLGEIEAMEPEALVLSPGPGRPEDAGICMDAVRYFSGQYAGQYTGQYAGQYAWQYARQYAPKIPILGVCLGHQAICSAFGARITHAGHLMHGKASMLMTEPDSVLFAGRKAPLRAARYHSLAAAADSIPSCLRVTARAEDGEIMAVEHRQHPVFGVQFHPESILTPDGEEIVRNFIEYIRRKTI